MKEGKTGRDGKERGAGLGAGGLGHPPPCWGQSRDTHQRHPGSAFGEGAAPLLGAGLMLAVGAGVCAQQRPRQGGGHCPSHGCFRGGKLIGNCSP